MRVVVCDDSLLTREGVVGVLGRGGLEVVGQAADGDELLALVAAESPDVAIVDIRMPPTHTDEGLVVAAAIRERHPEVGVLVLSHHVDPGYALRLVRELPERAGYLLKDRLLDGAVLVDAVRRVGEGETVVDATIVSVLLGRRRVADPIDTLTGREREVLGLLAEGLSNRAIAERLSIAERTVEAHVTQTFLKLGLAEEPSSHRRVLAVLAYLRHQSAAGESPIA